MATETRTTGPFARKSAEQLVGDTEGGGLKRAVGALDLTALGLGAIIGTGIFVIIGEAIGTSGPAIILSFLLAGVTCVFSALSYSELASSIPVSGSAYTYSYATMGELVAFIIGWDLILEYGFSVATVAVGWGGYLNDLLSSAFGLDLPNWMVNPPGEMGGKVNLTAVVIVLAVTAVLVTGVRESARANTIMVFTKLAILTFFVVVGIFSFKSSHFTPFQPEGFSGTVSAASLIFFAYIGFDAVSTSGEETKNPKRDLPIAIIGSLVIATILYIIVAVVTVGLVPVKALDGSSSPLTDAIKQGTGLSWAGDILSLGALIAITSVILTILYGQSRIMFAMSRDGLVPKFFGRLNTKSVPAHSLLLFGGLVAVIAAFVPLSTLAELVNIGTLFAFALVNIGVIVLRRTDPGLERQFRVPFVPVTPLIGLALCIYLMTQLKGDTWLRFIVWLLLGLGVYFFYSRRHSRVQAGEPVRDL